MQSIALIFLVVLSGWLVLLCGGGTIARARRRRSRRQREVLRFSAERARMFGTFTPHDN